MSAKLINALKSVDWAGNVDALCSDLPSCARIETASLRLAIWSKQLEQVERGNPAISFIREMQHCGHHVASLLGLALYKPAAASMRALVECSLYYSYFRVHPVELATLVRVSSYYLQKGEIISYHETHTPNYLARQALLGLNSRLSKWYAATSAIVHGQIPGAWGNGTSVEGIVFNDKNLDAAMCHFEEAIQLVNDIFLCVVAPDVWRYLDHDAKRSILKGMPGDKKECLGLDAL